MAKTYGELVSQTTRYNVGEVLQQVLDADGPPVLIDALTNWVEVLNASAKSREQARDKMIVSWSRRLARQKSDLFAFLEKRWE